MCEKKNVWEKKCVRKKNVWEKKMCEKKNVWMNLTILTLYTRIALVKFIFHKLT